MSDHPEILERLRLLPGGSVEAWLFETDEALLPPWRITLKERILLSDMLSDVPLQVRFDFLQLWSSLLDTPITYVHAPGKLLMGAFQVRSTRADIEARARAFVTWDDADAIRRDHPDLADLLPAEETTP